jgi:hypothetical protein
VGGQRDATQVVSLFLSWFLSFFLSFFLAFFLVAVGARGQVARASCLAARARRELLFGGLVLM